MVKNIEKVVLIDRKNRMRIRSIMKHLQTLSINDGQLRLVILEDIVECLKKNNLPYGKREIYSAFGLVPKNEYNPSYKNEIINKLSRNGKKRSVFTTKHTPRKPEDSFLKGSNAFTVSNVVQNKAELNMVPNHHSV